MIAELSTGWKAKLGRAKEHLDSLRGSVEAFVGEGKAYAVIKEADRETGEYVFRLRVCDVPPVVGWSLAVGDCLHNTRTALDHLFWALVLKQNPQGLSENTSAINFPILRDASTFKGRKPKLERWVGKRATAALENLQPFNDVKGWNKNNLMFLHDFNNIDKHQLLIPAISVLNGGNLHADTVDNRNVVIDGHAIFLQFNDGEEIARFTARNPKDLLDLHYDVSFDLIFLGQPGPLGVIPALEGVIEAVEKVFDDFLPLL